MENNVTVVKNAINGLSSTTVTMLINQIPISKLYFSPKKVWVYAVRHGC
jgi:hypothetical protein